MAVGRIWTTGRVAPLLLLVVALAACGRDTAAGSRQQLEQRRTALLAAIAANPRAVEPQVQLARAAFALGDGVAAEAAIRRARELGGADDRLRPLQARAAAMQGETDRALAILDGGPIHPDMASEAAHIAANIYLDQGNLGAARAAFDRAVKQAPRDADLWVDVARFRDANADALGARDAVDYAIERDNGNSPALALKANLVRRQEGLPAALRWYDAALASDPDNVTALLDQAATLGDMGRYTAMLAAVRRAAALAPTDPRP